MVTFPSEEGPPRPRPQEPGLVITHCLPARNASAACGLQRCLDVTAASEIAGSSSARSITTFLKLWFEPWAPQLQPTSPCPTSTRPLQTKRWTPTRSKVPRAPRTGPIALAVLRARGAYSLRALALARTSQPAAPVRPLTEGTVDRPHPIAPRLSFLARGRRIDIPCPTSSARSARAPAAPPIHPNHPAYSSSLLSRRR